MPLDSQEAENTQGLASKPDGTEIDTFQWKHVNFACTYLSHTNSSKKLLIMAVKALEKSENLHIYLDIISNIDLFTYYVKATSIVSDFRHHLRLKITLLEQKLY